MPLRKLLQRLQDAGVRYRPVSHASLALTRATVRHKRRICSVARAVAPVFVRTQRLHAPPAACTSLNNQTAVYGRAQPCSNLPHAECAGA